MQEAASERLASATRKIANSKFCQTTQRPLSPRLKLKKSQLTPDPGLRRLNIAMGAAMEAAAVFGAGGGAAAFCLGGGGEVLQLHGVLQELRSDLGHAIGEVSRKAT